MPEQTYFPKGLGLGAEVRSDLVTDYHSDLVERLRARGHRAVAGPEDRPTTVRLAQEFGFCYGVERAVDYAYQTRRMFPDRDVYITGEIIHNPGVNTRLMEMGIRFLDGYSGSEWKHEDITSRDVVILPAFGVPLETMETLKRIGCIQIDSTCGSVLNVWKNVSRYAREGFTSIIHGKYAHEETRATASRATEVEAGHYLVVRDKDEARRVCDEIESPSDPGEFLQHFEKAVSPGFDPRRDLQRIGLANQTTMLSSESLEIAEMLRQSMFRAFGEEETRERFRSFDTICSATQDRQDAVYQLVDEGLDLMLVIGGFNSSNTNHLTEIAAQSIPTFHIRKAADLVDARHIRHLPVSDKGDKVETTTEDWLVLAGPLNVGVTAGASTPNSEVGRVVERLLSLRGATDEQIAAI